MFFSTWQEFILQSLKYYLGRVENRVSLTPFNRSTSDYHKLVQLFHRHLYEKQLNAKQLEL